MSSEEETQGNSRQLDLEFGYTQQVTTWRPVCVYR
jgi:hypothetical protein